MDRKSLNGNNGSASGGLRARGLVSGLVGKLAGKRGLGIRWRVLRSASAAWLGATSAEALGPRSE